MGSDNAPSTDQLQQWVAGGKLKFVLGSPRQGAGAPRGGAGAADGPQQQRSQWIQQRCKVVDPSAYGGTPAPAASAAPMFPGGGGQTLYECTA